MTLSIPADHIGSVIKGEVQLGQVLLVCLDDAFHVLEHDTTAIGQWAPHLISSAILDNRQQPWEVGARRRLTIAKAPYADVVLRETLVEKQRTANRAHVVFEYTPIGDATDYAALRQSRRAAAEAAAAVPSPSDQPQQKQLQLQQQQQQRPPPQQEVPVDSSFSQLTLDTLQKKAKALATPGPLIDPEDPSISERPASMRGAEAPMLLQMTTTWSLSSLTDTSTVIATSSCAQSGRTRCFVEVLVQYTLRCDTPGERDERILHDHTVLRSFLDRFWVPALGGAFANHVHAVNFPITTATNGGAIPAEAVNVGGGKRVIPTTATTTSASAPAPAPEVIPAGIGARFAQQHASFDATASLLMAKAKTPAEEAAATQFNDLLASWEKVVAEVNRNEGLVDRMVHELDSARHITSAATGFSAAASKAEVIYDYEEQKRL